MIKLSEIWAKWRQIFKNLEGKFMRKFLFFVLMFFGIFSFADELSLVQSFKFDGSIFYKKNTAKDESFYFLKNENFLISYKIF